MRSKLSVAETAVPEHTSKNMFGHGIWTARNELGKVSLLSTTVEKVKSWPSKS